MLSADYIARTLLENFGPEHGPTDGVTQDEALPLLFAKLESEGVYFADTYPGGFTDMAWFAAGAHSSFDVHHFAQYLALVNDAYSRIDSMAAEGKEKIRNLKAGAERGVDFAVVEFPETSQMPSFACFADSTPLAQHFFEQYNMPVHWGYVSKPRGGSLGSRVKRGDLNDYGTLTVRTQSTHHELMRAVIQQIHPRKQIDMVAMR
ncbi:hypothetical protein AB0D66_31610 [Streptomyces sp. NPDC048270]|uniref:hypothetical protein n=1 Tax=Streptomyces sp. NPDC048270 TaxID=3154615 RepID=UPI0033EBFABA